MTPRLSIIVVTYNSASCIADCLESVALTVKVPHEVVVVDNASQDDTVRIVRGRFPHVRLLPRPDNLGFSVANNLAARDAAGEYLLLLNNDTVVAQGAIDRLVARLDQNGDAGVVGPRLIGSDRRVQISFGHNIGFLSEAWQRSLGEGHVRGWPGFSHYVTWRSLRYQTPDWVSGACLLVRRSLYEAVGGMDENFFMYTEEVDLCARIRSRAFRVVYEPTAEVLHLGGISSLSNRKKTVLEYRRSQLYFYLKHHGSTGLRALRLYLMLKFGAKLARGRLRCWLGRPPDIGPDEQLYRDLFELARRYGTV